MESWTHPLEHKDYQLITPRNDVIVTKKKRGMNSKLVAMIKLFPLSQTVHKQDNFWTNMRQNPILQRHYLLLPQNSAHWKNPHRRQTNYRNFLMARRRRHRPCWRILKRDWSLREVCDTKELDNENKVTRHAITLRHRCQLSNSNKSGLSAWNMYIVVY